jgi:hypothetical protein
LQHAFSHLSFPKKHLLNPKETPVCLSCRRFNIPGSFYKTGIKYHQTPRKILRKYTPLRDLDMMLGSTGKSLEEKLFSSEMSYSDYFDWDEMNTKVVTQWQEDQKYKTDKPKKTGRQKRIFALLVFSF